MALPVFKKFPTAHPETHPLTQLLPISKLASHLFFSWSNSLEGPWGPSACGQRQRVREEDQRSHRKDFHFACQQLLRRRWRGPRCMSGELMCRRRNTLSTIESIWNYGVWVQLQDAYGVQYANPLCMGGMGSSFVCQQLLRQRWRGPRCMSGELMCSTLGFFDPNT